MVKECLLKIYLQYCEVIKKNCGHKKRAPFGAPFLSLSRFLILLIQFNELKCFAFVTLGNFCKINSAWQLLSFYSQQTVTF